MIAILAVLGIVTFYCGFVFRGEILLVLFLAVIFAIFLAMRASVPRMRWLSIEFSGGQIIFYGVDFDSRESLLNEKPIKSRDIRVGNLVCSPGHHVEMVEVANNHLDQIGGQDLSKWYKVVLVAHVDQGMVKLGILGRDKPLSAEPDERQYFRRARSLETVTESWNASKRSADVAKALTDLVDFLSEEEEREDVVVEKIVTDYGGLEWSVGNAINVGLSAGLIACRRRPLIARALSDAAQAFLPFKKRTQFSGHGSCKLKLTALGIFWRESEVRLGDAEDDLIQEIGKGVIRVNIVHGDHNEVHGPSMSAGRQNTVSSNTINQSKDGVGEIDIRALAQELNKLSTYLIAQASNRDQLQAIQQVEAALKAAESNNREAAISHLSKLGRLTGWVLGAGKAIGVGVAVSAINVALGNSH
jgi:hypothetical protein